MKELFKVGDCVRLRSGGPIMVIKGPWLGDYGKNPFTGSYICIWHIQGEINPSQKVYNQDILELVSEEEVVAFKMASKWNQIDL